MFHRFKDYGKRPKSPRKVIELTWFNYTESTSIHGLNYTTDLSLVRSRRISWGLIFTVFTSLAIFLIVRAYNEWQDNPVLTSIQSTGKSITNMAYPAITICNQGWIDQVILGAMLRQYRDFAKGEDVANSGSLQFGENLELEKLWLDRLYPGLQNHPTALVKSLASSDPEKHAKSDTLVTKGNKEVCIINPDCGAGWNFFDVEPSAGSIPKAKLCLKNYGFSDYKNDKCLEVGASRLFQTIYRDGSQGAGSTGSKFDMEMKKFLSGPKGIQWVETNRAWSNSQCALKSEHKGISLDQCKALLPYHDSSGANVINYSPKIDKGHCILKSCPYPIPQPETSKKTYKGYHKGGVWINAYWYTHIPLGHSYPHEQGWLRMPSKYKDAYLGCYARPHYEKNADGTASYGSRLVGKNSIDNCAAHCTSKGFKKYFSLEGFSGVWCRCLNSIKMDGNKISNVGRRPDSECRVKVCPGNPSQKCGGGTKGAIYDLSKVSGWFKPPDEVSFCGTLAHFHRPTSDIGQSFLEAYFNVCENPPYPPNNQALNICMKELTYCKERDNPEHLGCAEGWSLGSQFVKTFNDNSPDKCGTFCFSKGYQYFALKRGKRCRCGNSATASEIRPSGECNVKCPGNPSKTCGSMDAGIGRSDGYKIHTGFLPIDQSTKAQKADSVQSPTNTPKNLQYNGCYVDSPANRIVSRLDGYIKHEFSDNSPKKCGEVCGSTYFGLAGEHGTLCLCGNKLHNSLATFKQDEMAAGCYKKCPGDISKDCGGKDMTNLYTITKKRRKRQISVSDEKEQDQVKRDREEASIKNRERDNPRKKKEDNSKEKVKELNAVELAFDPALKPLAEMIKKQSLANTRQMFQNLNSTAARYNLFEILWYTQLPCFDVRDTTSIKDKQYSMLKSCYWMGTKLPCSEVFQTVPTDRGMCCSFNLEKAQNMFEGKQFRNKVHKLQTRDKAFAFEKVSEISPVDIDLTPRAGRSNGLRVILDARSDKVSQSSVNDDNNGFYALVDSPQSYPQMQHKSLIIPSGQESEIGFRPIHIASGPGLKGAAKPEKRFCLFADEYELKLHKKYSQNNCKLECSIKYAQSQMNVSDVCVPWYLPAQDSLSDRMCSPHETFVFKKLMKITPETLCKHCLPDCLTTNYPSTVSYSPFRRCDAKNLQLGHFCTFNSTLDIPIWANDLLQEVTFLNGKKESQTPNWIKTTSSQRKWVHADNYPNQVFGNLNKRLPTYHSYEEDIAVATFYFDGPTGSEYMRDARMTIIDFISQLGGLAGVCIGLSLMSVVELIYWFPIRLLNSQKQEPQ